MATVPENAEGRSGSRPLTAKSRVQVSVGSPRGARSRLPRLYAEAGHPLAEVRRDRRKRDRLLASARRLLASLGARS